MRWLKAEFSRALAVFLLSVICTVGSHENAQGELHWHTGKKQAMRIRLVALALTLPRSSFFSTHEVFIAEKQLGREEWRLVKLVYEFLPYQPRLSDEGLNYSIVHELRAVRDPGCDETLAHMTSRYGVRGWSVVSGVQSALRYSAHSPLEDLERRRTPLPCYQTSAQDYNKSVREPASVPDRY